MDFAQILEHVAPEGVEALVAAVAVALATAAVGGIFGAGFWWGRRKASVEIEQLHEALKDHKSENRRLKHDNDALRRQAEAEHKRLATMIEILRNVRIAKDEGFGRALAGPPAWSAARSEIPIIAVGNLKGGVGKTTLAANLGAYYGDQRHQRGAGGRPTLFIDFDFQGSLSSFFLSGGGMENENRVVRLFDEQHTPDTLAVMAREVMRADLGGSRFFDATAAMADAEEQMFFDWMLSEERDFEPRLRLSQFLSSGAVQKRFGAVVIDLPPRTTMFAYNALCAATHVVIPTREDALSRGAAATFAHFLEAGREDFWPRLQIAGLAGVNTTHNLRRTGAVDAALAQTAQDLRAIWRGQSEIAYVGKIPWMDAIAQAAAVDFAYFDDAGQLAAGTPHGVITAVCDAIKQEVDRTL